MKRPELIKEKLSMYEGDYCEGVKTGHNNLLSEVIPYIKWLETKIKTLEEGK